MRRARAVTGQSILCVASWWIVSPATPFFWLRMRRVAAVAVKNIDGGDDCGMVSVLFQNCMSPKVKPWVRVFSFPVSEYSTDLRRK